MNSFVEFNNLYNDCIQICERNNIHIPENGVKRKRNENSSSNNTKETYMNSYDKIIDIFIKEIQERFKPSNLEPVLELFKVIMPNDTKTEINLNKLKIYENLINIEDLKLELLSYIKYRDLNNTVSWIDFDVLVKEFDQRD